MIERFLTSPLVGYVRRNWVLLLITAAFAWLAIDDLVFAIVGWMVYPPVLCFEAILLATLFRHIFNRRTTDAYTDSRQEGAGSFSADFASLPPVHKVWLTSIQIWVYILAFSIVVAVCAMK